MSDMLWTEVSPARRAYNAAALSMYEAIVRLFTQNWLLLMSIALGLVVGGALATPLLYALGVQPLASDLFTAYRFICGQVPSHSYFLLGYQLALCARNLAIYGSLLGGSVLFHWVRHWLRPLSWPLWLLTMLPMALDGFTQLFGLRESNWELRTLTGVIFGLGVCWFLLPQIQSETGVMKQG